MSSHEVVLFVHILGWVFWLGTDVGVYLGAKYAERVNLSAETRLTVLELGMVLDRFPRFAMPVVWLTGIILMNDMGYPLLSITAAVPMALVWLAVTWLIIFKPPGTTLHTWAALAQTLILAAVIIGMGGISCWLLATGEMPLWLAIKWFAYALVGVTVILLERAFTPAILLFGELAETGGNDDLNQRLHVVLKPVYPIVLAIYAWTILAAASGVSKVTL
ncbi:MAG: hypothetical protein AB8B57_02385 [Congregibacter sp.]